jgi:hypothetical protein
MLLKRSQDPRHTADGVLSGVSRMGQGVSHQHFQSTFIRRIFHISLLGLALSLAVTTGSHAQTSGTAHVNSAQAARARIPPVQSGVYGFSGGKVPYGDPEGVVGECIWIFDQQNKTQVAKGDCAERTPGKFRVVLKPGRYVIHGPGGNRAVEIKQGQWVKIESLVSLPLAP